MVVLVNYNRFRASRRSTSSLGNTADGPAAIVSLHGEAGEGVTTANFGRDATDFCQVWSLERFLAASGGLASCLLLQGDVIVMRETLGALFVK